MPALELVGVCADGVEAVEAAVEHDADVVVLDLNMPRLDGLGATRYLQAHLPHCLHVLFTSEPQSEAAVRAAQNDVHVLDKFASDELVPLIEREAPVTAARPRAAAQVDTLVLAALAGRREDAVIVVGNDSAVRFYNGAAAEMLGLGFPPEEAVDLDAVRDRIAAVYRDGTPRPVSTRPLFVALAERRVVRDEVCVRRGEELDVYETRAVPFLDDAGRLLGAAAYWTRSASLPPRRAA